MALKPTEVTQAMLYRELRDPRHPHGGAMWVARLGLAHRPFPWPWVGGGLAALFCLTLLVSTFTGGNMFQAWNVADITRAYFGVPILVTGVVQMLLVGLVVIGGITRPAATGAGADGGYDSGMRKLMVSEFSATPCPCGVVGLRYERGRP